MSQANYFAIFAQPAKFKEKPLVNEFGKSMSKFCGPILILEPA